MKYFLTCLFVFVVAPMAMAQLQASKWYFNNKLAVDFSSGNPVPINDSGMQALEGCASISDADGNLLFYTNGQQIWNKNHQVMQGGEALLGHYSATQGALIVPKPGSNTLYYVFTVDRPSLTNANAYPNQNTNPDPANPNPTVLDQLLVDDGYNNGLNYVTVDISADNGNGAVTTGNTHLVTYDDGNPYDLRYKGSERLTGIADTDTGNIWVLTHYLNNFYAFQITTVGINPVPVISSTQVINEASFFSPSVGSLKFSPDAANIAMTSYYMNPYTGAPKGYVRLFDFDKNTGQITNEQVLLDEVTTYGIEFSPDGTKLYASEQIPEELSSEFKIYQFDLETNDIAASSTIINEGEGTSGSLQLAIDGKIYHLNSLYQALSCIHNPNQPAEVLNYQRDAVHFFGQQVVSHFTTGLPGFLQSNFNGLITIENTCLGEETQFTLDDLSDVSQIDWDLGNGTQLTGNTVDYSYPQTGTYTIEATVTDVHGNTKTLRTQLTIAEQAQAFPVDIIYGCDGDGDGKIDYIHQQDIINQVKGNQNNVEVEFYDQYGNYLPSLIGEEEGDIDIRVFNKANRSCYQEISVPLRVTSFVPFPIEDIHACSYATDGFADFSLADVTNRIKETYPNMEVQLFHENGEEIPFPFPETITNEVKDYEKLTLVLTDALSRCQQHISFFIIATQPSDLPEIADMVICADNPTGIQAFPTREIAESIEVKENETLSFYTENERDITQEIFTGYTNTVPYSETITARLSNIYDEDCYTETEFQLKVKICPERALAFFPKFFTPNEDGHNDRWQAFQKIRPHISEIRIFDRYGKLLATISPNSGGWDGTYKGKRMPPSSYWFSTVLDETYELKGHFVLLY